MQPAAVVYRFRAECQCDVDSVISRGWFQEVSVEQDPDFPDVEVRMRSHHDLGKVRELLSSLEDGHVMVQTVNTAGEYTGERDYDL